MKKSRILGYALTLAATLFVGSAMGQDVKGGTNYVEIAGTTHADKAFNMKSFITIDKTLGFYAMPDMAFHPGYTSANTVPNGGPYHLTPDFTWSWDITGATDVANVTPAGSPANYAEFTSSSIGVKTIKVKEKASVAYGGCEDATGKTFTLVVFAKPTIDFVNAATTGTRDLTQPCGSATNWKVDLNITASDFVTAKFKLEEIPVTVNPDGTLNKTVIRSTIDYNTAKLAAGTTYTKTAVTDLWTLSGTAFDYDVTTANRSLVLSQTKTFTVTGADVITLYRYSIVDGVSDFISRKSDGTGAQTFYPGTAATQTIDIYVKRAPTTGPVYHINNNIAK